MSDSPGDDTLGQALRSDSLPARDAATREVSLQNPRAVHALLDGLELLPGRTQARTLYAFAGAQLHQQSARLRDNRLSLTYSGPVSGALAELARRSGLLGRFDLCGGDRHVDIESLAVTSLQALDELCQAAGLTWTVGRYGVIAIDDGHAPAGPVAYDGPMKARLATLHCERRTDFVQTTSRVGFRIDTAFEWPLNPLTMPSLQLRRLEFDGRPVTANVHRETGADGNAQFACSADEFGGDLRKLDTMDAELVATFASGYTDCVVDEPEPGHTIDTKGFSLRFDRVDDDGYLLAISSRGISAAELSQDMLAHAISNIVLGVNADGDEAIAKVRTIMAMKSSQVGDITPELKLKLLFVRPGFGRPCGVRFRMTQGALIATHALRFAPVALP